MKADLQFISPDWPAPPGIKAFSTTRLGGRSLSPYESFNLGNHVGDDPEAVEANRSILVNELSLPQTPYWLEQVHGTEVITLPESHLCKADASYTSMVNQVCIVMTADCLPVLFTNKDGSEVAAAHAGWRGLADGVLERTIQTFKVMPEELIAWMGPAIGKNAFEVGDDVRSAFVSQNSVSENAFIPGKSGKWYADLYELAKLRLQEQGVGAIYGGEYCTYENKELFYSFRRDGQTGRMATLIYRTETEDL